MANPWQISHDVVQLQICTGKIRLCILQLYPVINKCTFALSRQSHGKTADWRPAPTAPTSMACTATVGSQLMLVAFITCFVSTVVGHGYLLQPASRNLLARQEQRFWNEASGNGLGQGSGPAVPGVLPVRRWAWQPRGAASPCQSALPWRRWASGQHA